MAGLLAIGAIAGGAKSWFDMGTFNLQPVEFVKIFLTLVGIFNFF